ncbi:MAG: hypothetical protein D6698_11435 [Gammaproteobacteria bacterium]|nr:MAG: hypothetical protein D6698_11435 [Gammaproteobacteria bacterium]
MLTLKNVTIRNFLSFGNDPITIDLNTNKLTTITGRNLDAGIDLTRNGTGKSTIIDAIAYCIYGKSVRGISNPKLVNKLIKPGTSMSVTIEFTCRKGEYRITRGEKPSIFRAWKILDDGTEEEITKNKNELTDDIVKLIGIPRPLFGLLVLNTTEQQQFMELPEQQRREIIEELMGLNMLSERAEDLKERRRALKNQAIALESSINTTQEMNKRLRDKIDALEKQSSQFETQLTVDAEELTREIEILSEVDASTEIEILTEISELERREGELESDLTARKRELVRLDREKTRRKRAHDSIKKQIDDLQNELKAVEGGICPTCGQEIVDDREKHISEIMDKITGLEAELRDVEWSDDDDAQHMALQEDVTELEKELDKVAARLDELSEHDLVFETVKDAQNHELLLEKAREALEGLSAKENPYLGQIATLNEEIVDVTDKIEELRDTQKLVVHVEYLIKMLQSKDSFVRKNIISRWTPFLNRQVAKYTSTLELPHRVIINDDFTITITDLGDTYDWGNLSRGQRQRINVALILSFIDLYEISHDPVNLLFIDELLDAGICARGANQIIELLRGQIEKKNKTIFVITHRQDIVDKVDNNIEVCYQNRISTIPALEVQDA